MSKEENKDQDNELLSLIINNNLDLSVYRDKVDQVLREYAMQNKVVLTLVVRNRLKSIEKMLTLIDRVEDELLNNPYRISKATSTKDLVKLYGEINKHLVTLLSLVQELDKEDIKNLVQNMNIIIKDGDTTNYDVEELRSMIMELKHKLGL